MLLKNKISSKPLVPNKTRVVVQKRRRRYRLTPFKRTLRGYAGSASVHGINYFADMGQHWCPRFFWLVAVLFFLMLGSYWSGLDYLHWISHPVVITAKSFGKPISNLEFPAISICSQGFNLDILDKILDNSNVNNTWFRFMIQGMISGDMERFVESCLLRKGNLKDCFNNWDHDPSFEEPIIAKTQSIDLFLNPKRVDEKRRLIRDAQTTIRNLFTEYDIDLDNKTLTDLLWHSSLPCFDQNRISNHNHQYESLKWCSWKNVPVPCSAIFQKFPTIEGICCAFNLNAADLYVENSLREWILTSQREDFLNSFEKAEAFSGWPSNPIPKAGKQNGLMVMLDAHSDSISAGSVKDDFTGFLALVGGAKNNPLYPETKVLLKPGHENLVTLSGLEITPDFDIYVMPPTTRGCYFRHEFELWVHRYYSRRNCVLECRMMKTLDMLPKADQCIPWNFPNAFPNLTMCNPWQKEKFMETFLDIAEDVCLQCLPDCHEVQYSASVTAAPIRRCDKQNLGISPLCDINVESLPDPPIWGSAIFDQFGKEGQAIPKHIQRNIPPNVRYSVTDRTPYNAYDRDIAVAAFYFESSTLFEYSRQARMTWIEFVAQVGGLLGLCLGLSFVSFLEVIYWFTYKFWVNW
ncbi:hypothetical protein TCAL_07234 [Tigriopus californicus]|uniref:Uncharacterized protein n=2 Tax=Tigriopus californicus TaxID=6832 RepID=A0A553NPE9_TIGCA|nr:hypothetical protein TCAL_07234 [Tigriopus californicus]|eukprot:TCALIF_07234-PA protein Name:"Similar to ppk28 Pickpocket protein 28 (Drosophila melanogaster)" AED:0.13 eAED:0.14 QI:0/-1/0/1/-1/1/1/0/633